MRTRKIAHRSGLLLSTLAFPLDQTETDKFTLHDRLALRTLATVTRRSDGSPVREIANGLRNRAVGEYVSYKSRMRLPWESRHEELDHRLLEVDPEVFYFLPQPHRLEFFWAGKNYRYTPDVEIWTERGHLIREVKEADELKNDPALREKLDLVAEIYHRAGYRFQVLTDKEIRLEPRLHNATRVQKHRRLQIPYEAELRLINHLESVDGVSTLDDCARAMNCTTGGREYVMGMMCRRHIRIDFSKPITGKSPVYRYFPTKPPQPSLALRRKEARGL